MLPLLLVTFRSAINRFFNQHFKHFKSDGLRCGTSELEFHTLDTGNENLYCNYQPVSKRKHFWQCLNNLFSFGSLLVRARLCSSAIFSLALWVGLSVNVGLSLCSSPILPLALWVLQRCFRVEFLCGALVLARNCDCHCPSWWWAHDSLKVVCREIE